MRQLIALLTTPFFPDAEIGERGGVSSCWLNAMYAPDDNSGSVLCVRSESMDAIVDDAGEKVARDDRPLEKKPNFPRMGVLGGLLVAKEKVEARECMDSVARSVVINS